MESIHYSVVEAGGSSGRGEGEEVSYESLVEADYQQDQDEHENDNENDDDDENEDESIEMDDLPAQVQKVGLFIT